MRLDVQIPAPDGHSNGTLHSPADRALTDAGVDHTLVFYPAHHGFAVPDNGTYDAEASTRHWARSATSTGTTSSTPEAHATPGRRRPAHRGGALGHPERFPCQLRRHLALGPPHPASEPRSWPGSGRQAASSLRTKRGC
jgi:hypothetical protein